MFLKESLEEQKNLLIISPENETNHNRRKFSLKFICGVNAVSP